MALKAPHRLETIMFVSHASSTIRLQYRVLLLKYIAWFIVKDSQDKMKLKGDYTARQKRGKLLELSVYSVKYLVQNAWKSLYFT